VTDSALTLASFLPQSWPANNTLLVFGALLAFGTLGGLIAARVRWLPTITGFMALGLLVGPSGLGLLSQASLDGARVLVDIALGLILFKLGATLHPAVVLRNRALVISSFVESGVTFSAILCLMMWLGTAPLLATLIAAIAVSSSPAVLIHVAQELHAKGPTLDTAKALVAMNNVLAFILFSLALPMALRDASFDILTSLAVPAYQLLGAAVVGVVVAWIVTQIALLTRRDEEHFRFALVVGAVMLALGAAEAFKVSSLFTTLTLGVACRWLERRSRLTRVQFGDGADLFFIILFVFAGANLHLRELVQFAPVALAYVVARTVAKCSSIYVCGKVFGYSHRQSVATGLLLLPMAGLAIGLVQTTSNLVPELGAQVSALVLAAVAVFETVGPPITAVALRLARETGEARAEPGETEPQFPDLGVSSSLPMGERQ
jgi:Kef-type K+ transport system membrane component KefB